MEKRDVQTFFGGNYQSFGSTMTGRNFSAEKYKFGFNGAIKDDEVKGAGSSYDFGYRMYDPRLGRFSSTDRLGGKFPFYSPYQFAGNKPIVAIDLDGLEDIWTHTTKYSDGAESEITVMKGDQLYDSFKQEMIDKLGFTPMDDGVIMTTSQFSNSDQTESIAINYRMASIEISEDRYSLLDKAGQAINDFPLFKTGNSYGSWEGSDNGSLKGRKGFLKTADLLDNGGTFLDAVAPFGKATPVIGEIAFGMGVMADVMRTMDDFQQNNPDAFKNAAVRTTANLIGEGVSKFLPKTGNDGVDDATKLMLNKGIDAVKDEKTKNKKTETQHAEF